MVSDPLKTRTTVRCLTWILESSSRPLQEHQALQTTCLPFSMSLYKEHQAFQSMVIIFHESLKKSAKYFKPCLSTSMSFHEEHQVLQSSYHFPWVSMKSIKSYTIIVSRTLSLTQSHISEEQPFKKCRFMELDSWLDCFHPLTFWLNYFLVNNIR